MAVEKRVVIEVLVDTEECGARCPHLWGRPAAITGRGRKQIQEIARRRDKPGNPYRVSPDSP